VQRSVPRQFVDQRILDPGGEVLAPVGGTKIQKRKHRHRFHGVRHVTLSNGCDKPVSPLGYGLDVAGGSRAVIQGFAEHRHSEGEIAFLHEGVRPELLHENVLVDQPAAVADQDQEHGERFRRQRNQQPIPLQPTFLRLQPEGAEHEAVLSARSHRPATAYFDTRHILRVL
jgi:hypothetical protein